MKLTKYNVLMADDEIYTVDATDRFTAHKTAMAMARANKTDTETIWAKTDEEIESGLAGGKITIERIRDL